MRGNAKKDFKYVDGEVRFKAKDYLKGCLIVLGLFFLCLVITYSIFALLKEVLPEYSFLVVWRERLMEWVHGDRETTDGRLTFAIFISLPITYIVVLGFLAWRNKWGESNYLIKEINDKFNIVEQLKLKIKEQENDYYDYDYDYEELLERIEKVIESDDLIKEVDDKFNIVEQLKLKIKEQDEMRENDVDTFSDDYDYDYDYDYEELLERIEKAIESDDLIKEINDKFNIVEQLKLEIKKQDVDTFSFDYDYEELLERIEKVIERIYKQ